jgi:GAF domain-containing protein
MGVPLKVGRDVIGHLTLDNRQPASYGEAEAALAQAFANQAAIAIENARLFETEQYQRKIAETLGEVAKVVSSSLELEEVLDRVLLELEKVTQYDGAMITFLEQDITYLAAARGFSNLNVTLVPSLPLNRLVISQKAIQARQTIVVPDIHQELNLDTTLPGTSKARCMIVAPLFSREEIIGLLSFVSTTPARYSERDAEIATQFAQHAAIAIENARLYEAERHQRQMAELLLDTSAAVVSSLDPSQVLLTLASRLREISDFHTCILYGWQPGKDYIHELANRGCRQTSSLKLKTSPQTGDWANV